ncbi:MAG TPA: efflux RND transporter periplasmic adaptor subunit [Bryobacteraceae bacterium]|jgi:multidrug efflux pump subunit AcrA (membrane-fusion protein)|nr:efflux RND transporter periplasmic adaptor subunit [Bryobacteraceae bacterium]
MRKYLFRVVTLAVLVAAGWYGYRWYRQLPSRQEQIATARVQRGDVVIRAYTRGELHAVRSVTLIAPNLNGTVQVTRLAPMGALSHPKDLVVEYDDSELQASLDEDQMSLEQTDEEIKGAKANLGVTNSEDALSLLKQRYAVRATELAVQKNPVTDAIDGKKNLLALEQAKRAVSQLETDVAMRKAQNDSVLAVLNEQRNRNLLDIKRDQLRIEQTKALADIAGIVSIRQNRSGNFNFGQVMPDIREGDTLQPGMQVADVLDLSEVEVWAKVGELDRANLVEGQDALLQLDSIPDKHFHGKVKALSGTATADVFSGDPSKKFDVIFSVDMRSLLSGLGMKSGDVDRVMATAVENSHQNVPGGAPLANFSLTPDGAPGARGGMMAAAMPGGRGPAVMPAGGAMPSMPGGRGPAGMPAGGAMPPTGAMPPGADASGLLAIMASGASKYTDADRKNARLPLPPDQDSEVQELLRPGLLADVEITVQKLPDAIHVPAQAIFQKDGENVVFVQQPDGKFQARKVELGRRSESAMVLTAGVEPGEVVALSDPTAGKSPSKSDKKQPAKGGPISSMPGGK